MPSLRLSLLLLVPGAAAAQQIPAYVPVNPVLASRSALYAQPVILPYDGWRPAITIDYSNAVEPGNADGGRKYLFDAELLQVDLWLSRDLSPSWFVLGNLALRSAHDGFLDRFLNGYHDLIGIPVPARNQRPPDSYAWRLELPDGNYDIARQRAFIGDLRLGVGHRIGRGQVVASVTLPTATNGVTQWSRGTIGTAVGATFRVVDQPRLAVELGAQAGWTPAHGELAAYQRELFAAASASTRWRVIGRQALFATVFTQSANWKATGFTALESPEITLDFGGLLYLGANWPALQIGMTEDLLPRGPSVDAGFRLGIHW